MKKKTVLFMLTASMLVLAILLLGYNPLGYTDNMLGNTLLTISALIMGIGMIGLFKLDDLPAAQHVTFTHSLLMVSALITSIMLFVFPIVNVVCITIIMITCPMAMIMEYDA